MLSYHNDPALKALLVEEIEARRAADQIVQGIYGEGSDESWRGCERREERLSAICGRIVATAQRGGRRGMTNRPALHLRIGLRGTGAPRIEDLTPHAPPALLLLRAMPGCDPEPPDRQPPSRRHWAQGGINPGLLAAAIAILAAIGVVMGMALGMVFGP